MMPIIFLRLLSGFCPSESCFIIIILFNFPSARFATINKWIGKWPSHCFHGDYTRFVLSTHKKRSLFFAKTCLVRIHSTCCFTAPKLVKTHVDLRESRISKIKFTGDNYKLPNTRLNVWEGESVSRSPEPCFSKIEHCKSISLNIFLLTKHTN